MLRLQAEALYMRFYGFQCVEKYYMRPASETTTTMADDGDEQVCAFDQMMAAE